jgi:hypothetical protein
MKNEPETGLPPPVLHKFMTLDGIRWDWFERLVRLGEIYFSSPADFNDPFDCLPRVTIPFQSDRDYKKRLMLAGQRQGDSRVQRREKVRPLLKTKTVDREQEYRETAYRRIRSVGVYCLTSSFDGILSIRNPCTTGKG